MIVRIIKSWDYPDILRQTPGGKGLWNGIKFTCDKVETCDYALVFNYSGKDTDVHCPAQNVWCILQEPPNEVFRMRHRANSVYKKVFTQDSSLQGSRYVHSQPALPWHANKNYDFLLSYSVPKKTREISCITSKKTAFQGHKARMNFLHRLKNEVDFDLIATFHYHLGTTKDKVKRAQTEKRLKKEGVDRVVERKWQGLAPYRYSLAIENFRGPYYWSEKLADCFLSYTMPIYYGCTNIFDYFPENSLIQIDINDPNAGEKIRQSLKNNLWEKNLKAIKEARNLVLHRYQFFPYFSDVILQHEKDKKNKVKKLIHLPNEGTYISLVKDRLQRLLYDVKNNAFHSL